MNFLIKCKSVWKGVICHKCGHDKTINKITDLMDGWQIMEEDYNCAKCGARVGNWAYGSFDDPIFYIETKWQRFKYLFLGIV